VFESLITRMSLRAARARVTSWLTLGFNPGSPFCMTMRKRCGQWRVTARAVGYAASRASRKPSNTS
jgi:hypothetical protein